MENAFTTLEVCEQILKYTPFVVREQFYWSDKIPRGYGKNICTGDLPIHHRRIDEIGSMLDNPGEIRDAQTLSGYLDYKEILLIEYTIYRPLNMISTPTHTHARSIESKLNWIYAKSSFSRAVLFGEWRYNIINSQSVPGTTDWWF
jgi:hypothetical protein